MAYLLKSGLGLLLVLGFYKIALENKRMHPFKRFYLLGSVVFSLLIPLLSFPFWSETEPFVLFQPEPAGTPGATIPFRPPGDSAGPEATDWAYGWWLYGVVSTLMVARFLRNLLFLFRRIHANPKQPHQGATLVLLDGDVLPHTFLHCLFLSEAAYRRGEIEPELLTHELAHVRQRHSLDVVLVELLLCFGWFNPLLFWCKRLIQFNHELLADEAVTRSHRNIPHYQHLLLSKLTAVPSVALASTLTFQTTKQRLHMMTRHTSRASAWLTASSAVLLLSTLTILIGTTTTAQVTPPRTQNPATRPPQAATDVTKMERLYADKLVILPGRNAPRKKFSELSAAEKQQVQLVPPLPRQVPTEALMKEWKNAKKFGVWLDDRHIPNARLNRYSAADIASYWVSYVHKNARQPENYQYQVDLMTKPAYEKYLKEDAASPLLMIEPDRKPKSR